MVKVLHLLTAIGHAGAEIWLLDMLDQIDRSQCAMDFCLKIRDPGPLEASAIKKGAKAFHVPLRLDHVGYLRALERIVREGKYDIIHTHEFTYSWLGVRTARKLNVPVVCTFHHWFAPPMHPIARIPGITQLRSAYTYVSLRYSLRNATYVTALSRRVLSVLRPDYQQSTQCRLISLSTRIPELATAEARRLFRRELGWPEDAKVIAHVGRVIEQKNPHAVIEIFDRVARQYPSARLVFAGIGPLLGQVLQSINDRGLSSRVKYLGLCDDVPRLLTMSDVFLFPSRDEGFGLAALEANAAGLPVVGSDIPGLDEAVVNGQTAVLHPVWDHASMADALLGFLRDEDLSRQFGNAGRARAAHEFSRAAAAQKLQAVYADCVDTTRGTTRTHREVG